MSCQDKSIIKLVFFEVPLFVVVWNGIPVSKDSFLSFFYQVFLRDFFIKCAVSEVTASYAIVSAFSYPEIPT